jgi:thiol-disulfide isomerase/thioredoxin
MKFLVIKNFEEFDNIFNDNNNDFILINISASWCKPCNNIKEELNEYISNLSIENSVFLKIDYDLIDGNEDFSNYFEISKIPYFFMYKDKSKISEFQTANIDNIRNNINSIIENNIHNDFDLSNDF